MSDQNRNTQSHASSQPRGANYFNKTGGNRNLMWMGLAAAAAMGETSVFVSVCVLHDDA